MAVHSLVKIWVHLIWSTTGHEKLLQKHVRVELFRHLLKQAEEMGVFIEALNVQADHVHCLLSLPPEKNLSNLVKSLKGESSRWLNESGLIQGRFGWARGYGAYSVSMNVLENVKTYIKNQEEHHKTKSFLDEYRHWAEKYLVWNEKAVNS